VNHPSGIRPMNHPLISGSVPSIGAPLSSPT
jgi:hypothetical protein